MFLITTAYQKSRSKNNPDKPGKVLFRITCRSDNERSEVLRSVSSNIYGEQNSVFDLNRAEILQYIRIIYSIIERHINTKADPSIDEIANDIRLVMKGDPSMKAVLKRAQEDFPIRADWVTIGNEYKREFQFIYPEAQVLPDKLLEYITFLSQQAKNNGKEPMSRSYNSTRSSLSKFLNGQDVQIDSIEKHFVTQYSDWLKENAVIDSTQSFYLRTLRAILNRAKEAGIETKDDDMFKGLNTRVKFSENEKPRATINREILNKILELKFQDNPETEVIRDMFMFAFYCRGMELTDVMNLTYLNIQDDMLSYNRRGVGRLCIIKLDKFAKNIIKKYRNTSGYIFPIKETYRGNQQYTINERVRRNIKEIGNAVGFPELTFSMNISAWKQLMSQLNISELLLKSV